MDAVFLGALAGVLFGAYTVAIRYGLSRGIPVEVGASVVGPAPQLVRRRGSRTVARASPRSVISATTT